MQLKTILNSIEKYKSFVYLDAQWSRGKKGKEIEIPIVARANSKPICSGCGKKCSGYDRLESRRFEYVPLLAIPVFFVYALRRVSCPECGVVVEWCKRANQTNIEPMQAMAKTLLKHEGLLLNWFESKGLSSGVVEGFNNKAKLTMRKAYGFKEFETIQVALYHQLAKLPEPKSAHKFC